MVSTETQRGVQQQPGVKPPSDLASGCLGLRAKFRVPAPEHIVQFAVENFRAGLQ